MLFVGDRDRSLTPCTDPLESTVIRFMTGSKYTKYRGSVQGVKQRINRSLDNAMKALDLVPGPSITRAALFQICGRAIRDWARPIG